jgi:hypothetical protein
MLLTKSAKDFHQPLRRQSPFPAPITKPVKKTRLVGHACPFVEKRSEPSDTMGYVHEIMVSGIG